MASADGSRCIVAHLPPKNGVLMTNCLDLNVMTHEQYAVSLEGPRFMQDCRTPTHARGQATHAEGEGGINRPKNHDEQTACDR